ncbi:2OG-Fe(II) oxygenase [Kordiimonas sp. SCSIO 12603]|uniref:2OG-Fe(II) oxygenase n=1 Tax=Kordiimonas sp. SCSIO 12603 TaxID=2829596 RepID=UPI00210833BE|nr:2OG-Fe(II) oxygenase [Kordiimonas sp. SCSIO 12603]UTW58757.1 2OG-Fe(II) oxygenase [Kordiimonas sp. SCSIO 12603]
MLDHVDEITPLRLHPQQKMSMLPYLKKGFLSVEECQLVVRAASENNMQQGQLSGSVTVPTIRSAEVCWIDECSLSWLSVKLARAAADINRDYFSFDLTGFDEGFQFLRYHARSADQIGDFYDWHIDIGSSGHSITRKLSMVIQLSSPDDYSGGTLEININGNPHSAPLDQGTLIAFPSFSLHRVCPVKSGIRQSLAVWMHGPVFR